MKAKTTINWVDNLAFEAQVDGFKLILDASVENGGNNLGPRPKPLLLAAMSTCSAMDVVSILKKMRKENYTLKVDAEADVAKEHPKTYTDITMTFVFTGDDLPQDKVINAVELSITKYCAVYATLKSSAKIHTRIIINEQEIWHD
jgi:putative redox protein